MMIYTVRFSKIKVKTFMFIFIDITRTLSSMYKNIKHKLSISVLFVHKLE